MLRVVDENVYEIKVIRVQDIQASNYRFVVRIDEGGRLVSANGKPLALEGNVIKVTFEAEYYLIPQDTFDKLKELGFRPEAHA